MKRAYRTIRKQGKVNEQELASFLVKNGQGLLPMVNLIEQCQVACNELIDVTGRAAIQAVLQLSAMEAAGGPPQQGKRRSGGVVFYGRQAGQVFLSDRKLEVERPRLRRKGPRGQEVEVPAYSAMQDQEQMRARMLDIHHGPQACAGDSRGRVINPHWSRGEKWERIGFDLTIFEIHLPATLEVRTVRRTAPANAAATCDAKHPRTRIPTLHCRSFSRPLGLLMPSNPPPLETES